MSDSDMVNTLFLTVLSRYPTATETEHRARKSENQPDPGGPEPALDPVQQSRFRF